MARKASLAKKPAVKIAGPKIIATSPVRNSPIPRAVAKPVIVVAPVLTHDSIAFRAFEISRSGNGGSDLDNWFRAEREIRGL